MGDLAKESFFFDFSGEYSNIDRNRFISRQKNDFNKLCFYLMPSQASIPQITYRIFNTKDGKQQADPNHSISKASARLKELAIYRFWDPKENPSFPHKITHLIAHTWSAPYVFNVELDTADGQKVVRDIDMVSTSFMQEGLAIAVDEILFQHTLREGDQQKYPDDYCRQYAEQLPSSISQVINLKGFGSLPNEIVVPFAASLSKYLIGEIGIERYKELYIALKETLSPDENLKIFESVTNMKEKVLLSKLKQSLRI